jgi:hypothetical protein
VLVGERILVLVSVLAEQLFIGLRRLGDLARLADTLAVCSLAVCSLAVSLQTGGLALLGTAIPPVSHGSPPTL